MTMSTFAIALTPSQKRQVYGVTLDGCSYSPEGTISNGEWIDWGWACDQHDLDYSNPYISRAEADLRLYNNMINAGAPEWIADSYYQILRKTGQPAWEAAQRNYSIPSDEKDAWKR
jgi:hypothetical protein